LPNVLLCYRYIIVLHDRNKGRYIIVFNIFVTDNNARLAWLWSTVKMRIKCIVSKKKKNMWLSFLTLTRGSQHLQNGPIRVANCTSAYRVIILYCHTDTYGVHYSNINHNIILPMQARCAFEIKTNISGHDGWIPRSKGYCLGCNK